MFATKAEKHASLDLIDLRKIEGGSSFAKLDTEE
jgi:hypothetical protein